MKKEDVFKNIVIIHRPKHQNLQNEFNRTVSAFSWAVQEHTWALHSVHWGEMALEVAV